MIVLWIGALEAKYVEFVWYGKTENKSNSIMFKVFVSPDICDFFWNAQSYISMKHLTE